MDDQKLPPELPSFSSLCGYIQDRCEQDRNSIANQLHDEIGGLLVSARLNVAWIEERLPSLDPDIAAHFRRLHDALRRGVEIKRRIVEDLRPTLLDNIGLYSALRWQMAKSCEVVQLDYSEDYPEEELSLLPEAGISVFRTVEEAIGNVIRHAAAQHVHLAVAETADALQVGIHDDGVGITAEQRTAATSFGIAAMTYRVTRLAGELRWSQHAQRGTELQITLPMANLLRADTPRYR